MFSQSLVDTVETVLMWTSEDFVSPSTSHFVVSAVNSQKSIEKSNRSISAMRNKGMMCE